MSRLFSFKNTGKTIEYLEKLDETNKQVVSFADQLQNLQDILKNPKQRGVLGEYYLEIIGSNASKGTVDAVKTLALNGRTYGPGDHR